MTIHLGYSALFAILAYLDPATGNLLFSLVLGSAAAFFFVLKGLIHRGRGRLLKIIGRYEGASDSDQALVLYSEGRQYAGVFRPILNELIRREMGCLYLSSDLEDPLLSFHSDLIQTKHVGKGYASWAYLNTLQADVCIMTTPGLDVLQIKRSKHVGHYAHVIHAPTDKAFNRPYSFDYFDSVFICGPHQERTIRTLEAVRGAQRKQLFLTGCVYYDELVAAFERKTVDPPGNGNALRVLVAPTWGKNGLLTRFGMKVLQPLMDAGYLITVRPHPQSRSSEPELLAKIQKETKTYGDLKWDDSSDPLAAMSQAEILVSDISGIIFDFCFLTGRPVVTLAFEPEKRGFEASDLPYEPWELSVLDQVGRRIGEGDLERLPEILAQEANDLSRREEIRGLRDEFVVNFGCAAGPIVEELANLLALEERAEGGVGERPQMLAPSVLGHSRAAAGPPSSAGGKGSRVGIGSGLEDKSELKGAVG